jgi:hypothetical protein
MAWEIHLKDNWFRTRDFPYAGKEHNSNKTFILIYYDKTGGLDIEKCGFSTIQATKNYVDNNCL